MYLHVQSCPTPLFIAEEVVFVTCLPLEVTCRLRLAFEVKNGCGLQQR